MATTSKQEVENRRILEELQQQKRQLMMKQGQSSSSSLPTGAAVVTEPKIPASAKLALQAAQNSSFGYFIAQDSAYGNSILPVFPRFDPTPPPAVQSMQ